MKRTRTGCRENPVRSWHPAIDRPKPFWPRGDTGCPKWIGSFGLLLSTDQNIRYQQDLRNRKIAVVVLMDQQWPNVRLHLETIAAAIDASTPGSYVEVKIPLPPKKPFTRS